MPEVIIPSEFKSFRCQVDQNFLHFLSIRAVLRKILKHAHCTQYMIKVLSLTFKNISIVDYETKVTLFYERKKKVYCTFRCILDDQFLALLSNGLVTFHIISTHKIAFHIISTSLIWTRIIFQLILFQPIIFLKNFKIKKKKNLISKKFCFQNFHENFF